MSVRLKKCRQRRVRLDHRLHQLQADFTICGVRSEAGDGLAPANMCVQRPKKLGGNIMARAGAPPTEDEMTMVPAALIWLMAGESGQ
jgi:hypothetical protein